MITNLPNDLPEEYWVNVWRLAGHEILVTPDQIFFSESDAIRNIRSMPYFQVQDAVYLETIHVMRGAGPNAPSIAHVYDLRAVAKETSNV